MSLVSDIKKFIKGKKADGVITASFDPINRPVLLESISGEYVVKVDGVSVSSDTTIEKATEIFEFRIVDSNRNL